MKRTSFLLIYVALEISTSLPAHAYEVSVQKFDKVNQKSLCSELYAATIKKNTRMINEKIVCREGDGKKLTAKLDQLELQNRIAFRSNIITRELLGKISSQLIAHKEFISSWKTFGQRCKQSPRSACLATKYLIHKDALQLMQSYKNLEAQIIKLVGSQPPPSFITQSDLKELNLAFEKLTLGKSKLSQMIRSIGETL